MKINNLNTSFSCHVTLEKFLNVTGAIQDYEKAIEYPTTSATATAYYNLGIALRSEQGEIKVIENHIEMALNLGMDLTVRRS